MFNGAPTLGINQGLLVGCLDVKQRLVHNLAMQMALLAHISFFTLDKLIAKEGCCHDRPKISASYRFYSISQQLYIINKHGIKIELIGIHTQESDNMCTSNL